MSHFNHYFDQYGFYSHTLPVFNAAGFPPDNATQVDPPPMPQGSTAYWDGKKWTLAEDHRQQKDELGRLIDGSGTPFWLPGDAWDTPARYMDSPGPLPEDALMNAPDKPLALAKQKKREEVQKAYADVLAYMLADSPNPTPIEAALATDDMRVVDPEGLVYARELAQTRRAELLTQVEDAQSLQDVASVVVNYPV